MMMTTGSEQSSDVEEHENEENEEEEEEEEYDPLHPLPEYDDDGPDATEPRDRVRYAYFPPYALPFPIST